MNVAQLIESAKKQTKTGKDSELAKILGTSRGGITNYKTGDRTPDEYVCFKLAELLNMEPAAVIAIVRSQAEKNEEKRDFWKKVSQGYGVALSAYFMVSVGVSELLARGGSSLLHNLNY